MNKDLVRRVLLVTVSILNWIFSVGFIREIYDAMLGENSIEYADNINVDGSDFTPLANLAVAGANGMMILLTVVLAVLFATIFILIFAILLRATTIRKKDIVTGIYQTVNYSFFRSCLYRWHFVYEHKTDWVCHRPVVAATVVHDVDILPALEEPI